MFNAIYYNILAAENLRGFGSSQSIRQSCKQFLSKLVDIQSSQSVLYNITSQDGELTWCHVSIILQAHAYAIIWSITDKNLA